MRSSTKMWCMRVLTVCGFAFVMGGTSPARAANGDDNVVQTAPLDSHAKIMSTGIIVPAGCRGAVHQHTVPTQAGAALQTIHSTTVSCPLNSAAAAASLSLNGSHLQSQQRVSKSTVTPYAYSVKGTWSNCGCAYNQKAQSSS